MNLKEYFTVLNIDEGVLTDKKLQTDYKIKYVSEYVKRWAIISAERENVKDITFIDCMCNAGVYRDGDCCTALEVLYIFKEIAKKYKDKTFKIYFNDINSESIAILKKIIQYIKSDKENNLLVYITCKDVNVYLSGLEESKTIFGYGKSVIVYVDPFDFGTVEIPRISKVLEKHYCEVIFNFFISDYVRNIKNDKNRIKKCIEYENVNTKDDIIKYIKRKFKVGKIKHFFSYQFKTKTNTELYQIVFVTPNIKGLEVLKDVLWKVFDGKEFYRNTEMMGQLSIFDPRDEMEMRLMSYAQEARSMLCAYIGTREVTYNEIEIFLIENTMLASGQIIKNVLNPLINVGKVVKKGDFPGNSYKRATYKAR